MQIPRKYLDTKTGKIFRVDPEDKKMLAKIKKSPKRYSQYFEESEYPKWIPLHD